MTRAPDRVFKATNFGSDVARAYDARPHGDEAETVELLFGLAHDAAPEHAIGTGIAT